jgi:ABC-2 type transport system permease protein
MQLNVDATRMSQAFSGSGYIQQIFTGEVNEFVQRYRGATAARGSGPARALQPRADKAWFGSVVQIINHITLLSIILTGAALIREREHGTIEHLLVMPVTPAQIMLSKVWSMAAGGADRLLPVPQPHGARRAGRAHRGLHCAVLRRRGAQSVRHHLDGHLHRHLARNMPQFGMLMMLTIMPLQMLSGGTTPRESMPEIVQNIMLIAPTTHFVELSQAILYRGAGWRRCGSPSWRWP